MSASGYKRTYSGHLAKVCFTPNSGRSTGYRRMSAFDPKRTFARDEVGLYLKSGIGASLTNEIYR